MRISQTQRFKYKYVSMTFILAGLFTIIGVSTAQDSQTVIEFIEMTRAVETGNELMSSIFLLIASVAALGSGVGIVIGSVVVYTRKKKQIKDKLN